MSAKAKKQPMSNKKYLSIWIPVLAVLTALLVVVNVGLNMAQGWVASQFGTGTYTFTNSEQAADWDTEYYEADYSTEEDVDAAAQELVSEIAGEGIVLAKNADSALPLQSGAKVTMFGRSAADPVYGGSGSGSVDTTTAITARAGLENAGFEVNDAVYQQLAAYAEENDRGYIEMDNEEASTYYIGEMPASGYDSVASTFEEYDDAALVYIARPGGEGGDLTRDMEGWDENYVEGQHQLELNQDEQDMIALAAANFETVVVLVNASTTLEMGPVQDNPDVDAVLLIGSPGATGFDAVGQVLAGETNPSGRTVDTWAADFTQDPSYANFGDYTYTNLEVTYPTSALESVASNADVTTEATFVNYAEGIYVGYRYYETAAVEGFIDYDDAVVYPFGYGLSYTSFEWELTASELGGTDGDVSLDITVTNTGDTAGKDVVEVYYSAPYTPGGIEKASVVLAGFAKTSVLEPGQSETVTVSFAVEDMASYDYENAQAYVLEDGDYAITVQTDSHNVAAGIDALTYTVDEDIVYSGDGHRSSDESEVTNQFDDVSAAFSDDGADNTVVNLSRADFAGTFPTSPTQEQLEASDAVADGFAPYDAEAAAEEYAAAGGEEPTTGADSDLTLIDLRGLDYSDPAWDELLDSLTVSEMSNMLLNGAYQTSAIAAIAKPATVELDGPAGFSSFINSSVNGVAYPSEYLIAQTWNVDLGYQMGQMLGNESLVKGVSGWYAPAVNLHRSPFAGRNFEYYSEDPLLSGAMATYVSNGAGSKGLYTMLKHFALNDQETNRINNGVATFANEQTIRELYLRPFEIAVKSIEVTVPYITDESGTIGETTVGAMGVMSSFNRIGATWTGGSTALMDTVLRGEWGFTGFAISDFNLYTYMNPNQGINAGTDLTLTFSPSKSFEDTSSALAVTDIRTATHNVLYTVANSNAMNGMAPGATVDYTPPMWRYIQVAASVVVGLAILAGAILVVRRVRKH